jgi:hypothetical protein
MFSDLKYPALINQAKIAIQYELNQLVSNRLIPYERVSGSLTQVTGQRVYDLPQDFIRFYGRRPFLIDDKDYQIFETDLDRLSLSYPRFEKDTGQAYAWYAEPSNKRQIGLVNVPYEDKAWNYKYEKDVSVTSETDSLPFHTEVQAQSFIDMAIRHFELTRSNQGLDILQTDQVHNAAEAKLMQFLRISNPNNRRGYSYIS